MVCLLAVLLATGSARAEDLDCDGIPDAFEDQLLQQFAPVIKIDQLNTTPSEFRAIPVSASWFVQHTDLGYDTNLTNGQTVFVAVLTNPTPESLIIYSATNRAVASQLKLHFRDADWKWGGSPIDPTSWPDAILRNRGVYGRVWRPWTNTHPHLYSVQYFMLLTWNETGDCDVFNEYRHDGDVLCFDYGVDASVAGGPTIVHAIYHNHGRQIFMTREGLGFENGRPLVFLERGVNEPWPNAGTDGAAGRPMTDGAAYTHLDCGPFPESCCVRQHQGEGNVYFTADIPNIGEAPWPDGASVESRSFLAMGSLDSQLFLHYPGSWGRRADPPEGPAIQRKIWRREFEGPWAAAGPFGNDDPLRPNLEAMSLGTACMVQNMTNVVCYDFLPICDVRTGSTNEQRGLPSMPFTTVTNGVQKVASYGVLRIGAGTYTEAMEISKPMLIESAGGLVTIGQ